MTFNLFVLGRDRFFIVYIYLTSRTPEFWHAYVITYGDFTKTVEPWCPYSEFSWSLFSPIRTQYGEIRSISPYSDRMQENTDQKNSECRHFLRSVLYSISCRNSEV